MTDLTNLFCRVIISFMLIQDLQNSDNSDFPIRIPITPISSNVNVSANSDFSKNSEKGEEFEKLESIKKIGISQILDREIHYFLHPMPADGVIVLALSMIVSLCPSVSLSLEFWRLGQVGDI